MNPHAWTHWSVAGTRVLCILFVALTWLSSGLYKLVDFSTFRNAVARHGVWPDPPEALLLAVILLEIALGVLIGSAIERRCPRSVVAVSLVATGALAWYITMLPDDVVRAGCGCGGLAAVAQRGPWTPRVGHFGFLLVLGLAHMGCLIRFPAFARARSAHVGYCAMGYGLR
jgi:uncharacterized membrane protein YphA (DoxX/SURF4 family)